MYHIELKVVFKNNENSASISNAYSQQDKSCWVDWIVLKELFKNIYQSLLSS